MSRVQPLPYATTKPVGKFETTTYGFWRPGLKTVWKMACFGLKLGTKNSEEQPPPPPPGGATTANE